MIPQFCTIGDMCVGGTRGIHSSFANNLHSNGVAHEANSKS